jgi:glutathione S-transferase
MSLPVQTTGSRPPGACICILHADSKRETAMPVAADAAIEISAYAWVPPFAKGLVRDLRVRWALKEAGLPYRERLLDATTERPRDYFLEQPFGQVPIYNEGDIRIFESGAIVLHIAERSEVLMPRDPAGRARTTVWVVAALNSIEPMIMELASIDLFNAGADWARARRPEAEKRVRARLGRLSDWLGDKDYLEGRFTAGDLMMTTMLRNLRHTALVGEHANLAAYQARCEARPAFQRALAAQLAVFERHEPAERV